MAKHAAPDAEEARLERELQQDAKKAEASSEKLPDRKPFTALDLTPATSKALDAMAVSYTHLTLPTKRIV